MPSSFSDSSSNSYADSRALVFRVIESYVDAVSLPRLSTFTLSDDGEGKHQRTLQPASIAIHFKADVEKITERILRDKPDLQETWWQIAQGETPSGSSEIHLVQKLQKAYKQIDPFKYLRPSIRKGSVESQRRAA
jgi:hypothetical protein